MVTTYMSRSRVKEHSRFRLSMCFRDEMFGVAFACLVPNLGFFEILVIKREMIRSNSIR